MTESRPRKYFPPEDPLEQEAALRFMMPLDKQKQRAVKQFVQDQVNAAGNPPAQQAWSTWLAMIQQREFSEQFDTEFFIQFLLWLQGLADEEYHQRTAWGRNTLVNVIPGVQEFVRAFPDKRLEWEKKLFVMQRTLPHDLNEAFLYFKYVVWKGSLAEYEQDIANLGGGPPGFGRPNQGPTAGEYARLSHDQTGLPPPPDIALVTTPPRLPQAPLPNQLAQLMQPPSLPGVTTNQMTEAYRKAYEELRTQQATLSNDMRRVVSLLEEQMSTIRPAPLPTAALTLGTGSAPAALATTTVAPTGAVLSAATSGVTPTVVSTPSTGTTQPVVAPVTTVTAEIANQAAGTQPVVVPQTQIAAAPPQAAPPETPAAVAAVKGIDVRILNEVKDVGTLEELRKDPIQWGVIVRDLAEQPDLAHWYRERLRVRITALDEAIAVANTLNIQVEALEAERATYVDMLARLQAYSTDITNLPRNVTRRQAGAPYP